MCLPPLLGGLFAVGSLLAIPLVTRRFGRSTRGLGLLCLLAFWLAWGLRALDGTVVAYSGAVAMGLSAAAGLGLVAGLAVLLSDLVLAR